MSGQMFIPEPVFRELPYRVECPTCGFVRGPERLVSAKITRVVHACTHNHMAVILPTERAA